jgi:nicotinate-nucleotide adenylyltransferase
MKERRNKLGILGGLFDPIHFGHISLCREAQKQFDLDRILFIPSYHPPHKHKVSSYKHRRKMVELAIKDIPDFLLSDLESEIEGPSYTVMTLTRLVQKYPDFELYFIIGSDNLKKMEEWYQPEKIFQMATVVMGNRPGEEGLRSGQFEGRLKRIEIHPMDISSTEIREAVRNNRTINEYVPPLVAKYIAEEGLYVE